MNKVVPQTNAGAVGSHKIKLVLMRTPLQLYEKMLQLQSKPFFSLLG